ncbi:MAG: hypothetical protein RL722_2044, partial [Pseudomonadota bacterium]
LAVQIKLLRVLQDRKVERLGTNQAQAVDVRVVAATKDDLAQRAREGSFRADLYYRLNVVTLELPPLRERREDIPLLMEHFMLLAASRYGRPLPQLGTGQLHRLVSHDWPGNVRELRNVADCLVLGMAKEPLQAPAGPATGPATDPGGGSSTAALPAADDEAQPLAERVEAYERGLISEALQRHGGNLSQAARSLQMAKTTLLDKVRKHGLVAARE